jgi:hypothetical protein
LSWLHGGLRASTPFPIWVGFKILLEAKGEPYPRGTVELLEWIYPNVPLSSQLWCSAARTDVAKHTNLKHYEFTSDSCPLCQGEALNMAN